MRAVDIIRAKRDGKALNPDEIAAFVAAATQGTWPDYQLAALLMAIVCRGMDAAETAALTAAMVRSGHRLDWSDLPGKAVDKHSTGGVGDKTSLILAPLAAACGAFVPMMSGRGLGHTGGTLDKLESIPGFFVGLAIDEFRAAVREVGCALVGQTGEVAPADKVLYALRDVTGTVESIPLITASIMSKKVAEGVSGLVLDVKCGRGAFMKERADARRLAESLIAAGRAHGVATEALVTHMESPLGRAVGNSLEVIESVEVLKGRGPAELIDLSVRLAAHMVRLAGVAATEREAEAKVRAALASGAGLEKLREIITRQGGDPRVLDDYTRLPSAPHRHLVRADCGGFALPFDAERLGWAAMVLGAGREKAEDTVDHAVGISLCVEPGQSVKAADPLLELHYRDPHSLQHALNLLAGACPVGDAPHLPTPLVLETIAGPTDAAKA